MADANHPPSSLSPPPSSSSSPPPSAKRKRPGYTPTLAVTSPDNYGRLDAENEENLALLASARRDTPSSNLGSRCSMPSSSSSSSTTTALGGGDDVTSPGSSGLGASPSPDASNSKDTFTIDSSRALPSLFLTLPSELIDTILSYLSPYDLCSVSAVCQALRKHALSDLHWHSLVQDNVPGVTLTSPSPCANYFDLYAAHDRLWFLPKYKLWFCDRDLAGRLIIVRYDPRRGCIEGYQLLAGRKRPSYTQWPGEQNVIIHGFQPQVKLHLDKPVLQFRIRPKGHNDWFTRRPGSNRFLDEMPMELDDRIDAMFHNFFLGRPLDPSVVQHIASDNFADHRLWPPAAVPALHRVATARVTYGYPEVGPDERPHCRAEVSDQTFRIRQWMEMGGSLGSNPFLLASGPIELGTRTGVRIGEELITYATLDPSLYAPTPLKPWRGIWVGDYSGHGCEFLLVHQPDDLPASDADLGLVRNEDESDEQWNKRRTDAHIYRGRLEAIKLTGDPNVPCGEYTFIADDLGPNGLVGVATDPPFAGARIVQSRGHVAETGFRRDKFIESQLLLISPNRMAQHWLDFGHISYFERVDIDSLLQV